ncbi:MAG: hypothetical protein FH756_02230 [Firmicutes bacterium]|nr:hypothetical protein [Bacillota bacterium]
MSVEDWDKVKERLHHLYDPVKLNCDGYEVTLMLERQGQFKNGIMVYVNGMFKGKWIVDDCEERRRFYRQIVRSFHSAKGKAELKKISKRLRQKCKALDPDAKYTTYSCYWKSFNALKKHFIKHNDTIELVK